MPFLPKQLTSLVTGDSTLARVGANVRTAVQPTLDFLQTNFTQGADGTLRLVRNTIANAGLKVIGSLVTQGDVTFNGNFQVNTRTGNGVVFVPTGGSPTFYCTNPANTDAVFLVDAAGTCNAVSYYSRNGFKRTIFAGQWWSGTVGMPTSYIVMTMPVVRSDSGATALMNAVYYAPFAGSVVAITCYVNGSLSGYTASVCLYKNGAATNLSQTGTAGPLIATSAKNVYTFNAGDALAIYIKGSNSAINQSFMAHIEIESNG